jgi:hypothetical protein
MEFYKQLKLLDDIVECYRAKRKAHTHLKWLTFNAMWGRIRGKYSVFDALRNFDIEFSLRAQRILHTHLKSAELSKREIEELVLYLKIHRSFISERDSFLVLYAVIIGVMLSIPRNDYSPWVTVGLSTLFGITAVFERWHMKLNDSLYLEIIEYLQHEAKEA